LYQHTIFAISSENLKGNKLIDFIEAELKFAVDTGEPPIVNHEVPSGSPDRYPYPTNYHRIRLNNARKLENPLDLDREGFILVDRPTNVVNFFDETELTTNYYLETRQLVKDATGATDVLIYNHTVRIENFEKREKLGTLGPTSMVHNDYSKLCGERVIRELLSPNEANHRLKNRYAMINAWRPISESVESRPLAICDSSTCHPKDLILTEHKFSDRSDHNYRIAFNPHQRWFYFPDMATNEVVLIKGFDSMDDGRAQITPHGGANIQLRNSKASRESIEVRTVAFF